ncbi:hypothetical protein CAEBREN_13557 [Caenorhabditis brenneri]|uniref:Helicase ATP-binding domain-containing protein n=1 Tax=Caenorhabditis brenneri TaxID=135651 RepID=G0PNJ6_CAEBE|nr:hypothetical protein CAEBREN_13557 [Caenorhabditis brenneri]
MSEGNNIYCGFFLNKLAIQLDDHNHNSHVIRVACFKPETDFRRVLQLKVEKDHDFVYGQLIHFSPRTGKLENKSLVSLHEDIKTSYEHPTQFKYSIIYILNDVAVSAEDLPSIGIYKHPDLGIMKDTQSHIKPGNMTTIIIKVVVNDDDDTFDIEVIDGRHEKYAVPEEEIMSPSEKFENIHEFIKLEHEYNKKVCAPSFFSFTKFLNFRLKVKFGSGSEVLAQLKGPFRHKKQKHKDNELFEHTLYRSTEEEIEEMKLMDLIDSRMKSEGEEIKDRGSQQDLLNESQFNAIKMALNEKRKVVCIQGPPGTGKTYVLAHLLATLLFRKKQAIVLTPTKEALKNIMIMTEKVIKEKNVPYNDLSLMDCVKFEKAVNDSPAAKDAQKKIVSQSYDYAKITSIHQAQWNEDHKNNKLEFEDLYSMKKNLINCTFAEAGTEIIKQTSFIFATMQSSFVETALRYKMFDPCMCVIDEAAQVMETQTWPAVMKMKRIVMAGDPKQLPALVMSEQAKAAKLDESIMDRIILNKEKFSWVITSFKIKVPTEFRTLFDPAVLVDTSAETDPEARSKLFEQISEESYPNELNRTSKSYKNDGEAILVLTHYRHLREHGIEAEKIAIIAPYRGQTEVIKHGMDNLIEKTGDDSCKQTTIGTVDSVQGQEYDCVIFSMVRSNPRKTMGFVCDLRRLNVVMTRAKRHFMFIGNGYLMANSWNKQIRDLFHEFNGTRHRFHPQNVFFNHGKLEAEVKNNFGLNFAAFVNASNDPEMKLWCADFVERQKDPNFIIKQKQRREQYYEAKRAQYQASQNGKF